MISRRQFIATSTAAATATTLPALAHAQAKQPFVLDPQFEPQYVSIKKEFLPGQILILPRSHYLYFVTAPGKAIRYGVGVGRAGLAFKI